MGDNGIGGARECGGGVGDDSGVDAGGNYIGGKGCYNFCE